MTQASTSTATEKTQQKKPNDVLRCTIVSIEKSDGPGGERENDWYRYVIDSPGSPITGYRRGKKSEVVKYLNECANQLEDRINNRRAPRASAGRPKKS